MNKNALFIVKECIATTSESQLILVIPSHSNTDTVASLSFLDFALFGHSMHDFCPSTSWKYPDGHGWHPNGLRIGGPDIKRANPVSEAYPLGHTAMTYDKIVDIMIYNE